jgi:hypothetical protein
MSFRGVFSRLHLLNRRARTLALGIFLVVGALGGMPIRPEEIEEQLQGQSKSEMVQILEDTDVSSVPEREIRLQTARLFRESNQHRRPQRPGTPEH